MSTNTNFLREDYNIDTPENVTFGYQVAGIGSRFIGCLIDTIIIVAALIAMNLLVALLLEVTGDARARAEDEVSWLGGLIVALYFLVNFAVFWGYYILFELLWNGQTPGKRATKIRVVRTDGNPAGFMEIAIRNLVRIVDFLPFGYGLGLVVMFFNRQARRLGDYAAGTLVVKERRDVALDSLRPAEAPRGSRAVEDSRAEALRLQYPTISRLSAADYSLIQETLERDRHQRLENALMRRLAGAIAARLECPPPSDGQARQFLEDVAFVFRHYGV
jgi:uncharacterized RDD family membrane protein YckC